MIRLATFTIALVVLSACGLRPMTTMPPPADEAVLQGPGLLSGQQGGATVFSK